MLECISCDWKGSPNELEQYGEEVVIRTSVFDPTLPRNNGKLAELGNQSFYFECMQSLSKLTLCKAKLRYSCNAV